MEGGDARRVYLKKNLKSLQNDRRVKTIVGTSWFLPQQRHLSAKVSWNWSVSSFVDEMKRSCFPKVGGGERHKVREPPLLEEGLKAVLAGARIIFFSLSLSPLFVDKEARGHRSLLSVILAERLFARGSRVTSKARYPLKMPGWIFSGLYGNINRMKVTCNSVINEMSLVSKIKCSAIKLFIWKVILRKPDFWHLVIY